MNRIPRREFIMLAGAAAAGLSTWPLAKAIAADTSGKSQRASSLVFLADVCLNGTWELRVDGFDESVDVRVPGSFAGQDQLWGGDHWDVWGYPKEWYEKAAVYRRTFQIPENRGKRRVLICFGGVRHVVRVEVNGKEVGSWKDSYVPFAFDITNLVHSGDNDLRMHITKDLTCGLFEDYNTNRRGIYRDVFLQFVPEVRVTPDLFVRTSVARKEIACDIPVRNDNTGACKVRLRFDVTDADGKSVKSWEAGPIAIAPDAETVFSSVEPWINPHFWSLDDPYLHHLNTEVMDESGNVLDRYRLRFGFREITWDKNRLFLNGQELFLRGNGNHELGDLEGGMEYARAMIRQLKDQGVEIMRMACQPRHAEFYEAGDEMGFLFISEASNFFRLPPEDIDKAAMARLVKWLRNHPSVAMWSVSNELHWRSIAEPKYLIDLCHDLDPTRPAYASDFSEWSRQGDVIGHHYDAGEIWSEWEKYGPDKVMVWDELGDVWQHDRPLKTGPAGYEISSQDVATGIWRDGWEQIRSNIEGFASGREINGQFYRVNIYVPWEFNYVFFRFLPFNNFQRYYPKYDQTEGTKGIKPRFINPGATTINIWDPTLPAYQPNPGLYCFSEYLERVRFPDVPKERTFFPGESIKRSGRLFFEDHRPADRVEFRVETPEGKLLTSMERDLTLRAGEYVPDFKSEWKMPKVDTATPVRLVHQFSFAGKVGYRKVDEAKVFPDFKPVDLSSQKVAVFGDSLQNLFGGAGVPVSEARIIVAESIEPAWKKLVSEGVRVLLLSSGGSAGGKKSNYSFKIQGGASPAAYVPPGAAQHRLLDGLGQEDFSFWRGGSSVRSLVLPDGLNCRRILFGNKDGWGSALQEYFIGRGVVLESALNVNNLQEPVAGFLIDRMVDYLDQYKPAGTARSIFVIGGGRLMDWLENLGADVRSAIPGTGIWAADIVAVDAQSAQILSEAKRDLTAHLAAGGTVLFSEVTPETIKIVREICEKPLRLTEPFFGQRYQCIKAPVSWARVGSPHQWVDYYDGVLVPYPFEPNLNPLIAGVANMDLDWDRTPMFRHGIEVEGMNPVSATAGHQVLISNWHIGSEPGNDLSGEQLNGVRDFRQNAWFVNRDPVVMELASRGGRVLISQLDLEAGGQKADRIMQTFLTNLGASFDDAMPAPVEEVYNPTARKDQLARFAVYDQQIDPVKRQYYGMPDPMPDYLAGTRIQAASTDVELPLLGFFGDPLTLGLAEPLGKTLEDTLRMDKPGQLTKSDEAGDQLRKLIGDKKYARVVFSLGESDLDAGISASDFQRNLESVWKILAEHSQQIFWVPIPSAYGKDERRAARARELNRVAAQFFKGKDVYQVPFVYANTDKLPAGYFSGRSQQFLPEEAKALAVRLAEAVKSFGAQ